MPPKDPDYFKKHYEANMDKIKDQKKKYYYEKVKYRKQFENIKLKGIGKFDSKELIKSTIGGKSLACFILVNNETMTPDEFYNKYSIKDFSIIEVDYTFFQNYELTMKIPDYYLTIKN